MSIDNWTTRLKLEV
nr:hypothetical protein [Carnobacterium iners]